MATVSLLSASKTARMVWYSLAPMSATSPHHHLKMHQRSHLHTNPCRRSPPFFPWLTLNLFEYLSVLPGRWGRLWRCWHSPRYSPSSFPASKMRPFAPPRFGPVAVDWLPRRQSFPLLFWPAGLAMAPTTKVSQRPIEGCPYRSRRRVHRRRARSRRHRSCGRLGRCRLGCRWSPSRSQYPQTLQSDCYTNSTTPYFSCSPPISAPTDFAC